MVIPNSYAELQWKGASITKKIYKIYNEALGNEMFEPSLVLKEVKSLKKIRKLDEIMVEVISQQDFTLLTLQPV